METLYFFLILLLVLINSLIDAVSIKKGRRINHVKESAIFGFFSIVFAIALPYKIAFNNWVLFCSLTTIFIRIGVYDFSLNIFRGKNMFYISPNANGVYTGKNESFYDDMLHKLKISPNIIRVIFLCISISWFLWYCGVF
jgi:hypothetical protein